MGFTLSPSPWMQFFDPTTGLALANGSVTTYAAGTSTPIATYKDNSGTPNSNPITLDASGRCRIYLIEGTLYKYIVTDSLGNVINAAYEDNIGGTLIVIPSVVQTVPNGGTGQTTLTNHGVLIGQSVAPIVATAAGVKGQVLGSGGPSADPSYVGSLTLLHAGHGSDASAAATTVDSIALSGLTVDDAILIVYTIGSVTQNTAQPVIFSVTDGTNLVLVAPNPLAAADTVIAEAYLTPLPGTPTSQANMAQGARTSSTEFIDSLYPTGITTWTGAWTIGLRHGGVTAGGSFIWSWKVYRMAGQ